MKLLKNTRLALLFVFLSAGTAHAAPFTCSVDVKNVLFYGNGAVNVHHSGVSGYTYICSLKSEYKGVSVETCAMWGSLLMKLKMEKKKAFFYYNSGSGYNSCATLPGYGAAPAPVYIGDVD